MPEPLRPFPPRPFPPRPFPPAAIASLAVGRKIEAIKIVRQEWGTDLKDSKDAVEAYIKTQPGLAASMQEAGSRQAPMLWLILALILAAALYYFLRSR
jgi:hypothetical protein